MKIQFSNGMLLVLALSLVGVAARAQSGVVGGQSNPTADVGASHEGAVGTQEASATAVDNGAMPGDSHVRIVRLSEAKGVLGLDRKNGSGFEPTMQNMPIVQGERLQTGDGYAEVEFEDNSTLRLAPNSRVDFPLLALRSSGAKASTMNVVMGTVYVSTENTKGNEFLLETGKTKMNVAPSTHLRVDVTAEQTIVSVFNGSVEVQRGDNMTVVDKKETLTLAADEMTVGKKMAPAPYDAWDKESLDYHQQYANANAFAGAGNAFGLSDLNYYGNFINAGGCGQMWQPYMVSAAWNPYSNGVWAMYPGAGYSWVSPYPWGWLPYHSGSWGFCQGVGWGWQPGNNWYGLNNIVTTGGISPTGIAPAGTQTITSVHSPLRPAVLPQAPVAGTAKPSLVLANQTPLVFSGEAKSGTFVFQKDSAGLGVPRGSLGSLNKISNDVVRHGSASMQVYAGAPGAMEARSHGASVGPATLRPATTNSSVSSASRQGAYEGSTGMQASPSYRSGGFSQPSTAAASTSSSTTSTSSGSTARSSSNPK